MSIRVPRFERLDAATNAFFERELQTVAARTYDIKRPPLKFREFIPVNSEIDPADEVYRYWQYEEVGVAGFIKSYADDFPPIDLKANTFTQVIHSLGDMYSYSLIELRQGLKTGRPLDARRAEACAVAMERKLDQVAALGDSARQLKGFLNNLDVPVTAGLTGSWAAADPDDIIADVNKMTEKIIDATSDVERPDTLLLPIAQYHHIAATPRSPNSDTTILEFILGSSPYISRIDSWHLLKGAGVGAVDRAMLYRRDPLAVEMLIPQEFEQLPPEERNMAFVVDCHARTGGVVWYYPISATYGDGI